MFIMFINILPMTVLYLLPFTSEDLVSLDKDNLSPQHFDSLTSGSVVQDPAIRTDLPADRNSDAEQTDAGRSTLDVDTSHDNNSLGPQSQPQISDSSSSSGVPPVGLIGKKLRIKAGDRSIECNIIYFHVVSCLSNFFFKRHKLYIWTEFHLLITN